MWRAPQFDIPQCEHHSSMTSQTWLNNTWMVEGISVCDIPQREHHSSMTCQTHNIQSNQTLVMYWYSSSLPFSPPFQQLLTLDNVFIVFAYYV